MAAPQPQRSRGFSVKSDKSLSKESGTSSHKRGPSESSQEKARRNLHTKADPLIAMNEIQPSMMALEKSNLGSLREMEHKDQFGNVITDPDLSNPTRPRFERPLDTIRSFEAAIYGSSRAAYARTEDAGSQMGDFSRRTSYYGGQTNHRLDQQNPYNSQSRPDSVINAYQNTPQGPENPYPYNNGNNRSSRRPQYPRGASVSTAASPISQDPHYGNIANTMHNNNNNQYGYPQQGNGYQRSYDNVTALSGSGSGNTDPYQTTDPSSLNSSNDQLQQQVLHQQRMDERAQAEYGFNGFGSGPHLKGSQQAQPVGDPNWGGPVGGRPAPAPPAHSPLASGGGSGVLQKKESQSGGDKRKSWFKRRFSKD
ncbi:hypothetical protein N7508_005534 [Penicillium antarcticum]|uniref:uncharacterized protein n=1 Tax=Penicillium antarcticum TaxID=416450 RepID=UPI0023867BAF|nr:uncharacterized protein N7508_005534 [Penicillium antarcticum]KAJ5306519.1 hypothetical protein N7508_005534 [Penicillium antarcticum]